uniref:Uncharacterized protein n=1 Tax=Timema poppense TaxID=170557 RepID=A0A7R9CSW6_TIMPO|nr:unnamed protein product [Timema poppensis]
MEANTTFSREDHGYLQAIAYLAKPSVYGKWVLLCAHSVIAPTDAVVLSLGSEFGNTLYNPVYANSLYDRDLMIRSRPVIEPVPNLYINSTISTITAQWTASNSSSECIAGYEVCWNRSSLVFTDTTCSNVSANTTSHSHSGQHENCIDYAATITTLGVNGLRSNPKFTSISISPSNVNGMYLKTYFYVGPIPQI